MNVNEPLNPLWLRAYLDLPADLLEPTRQFWCRLTGWTPSEPRGAHGEFCSLIAPDGDDYLRVQRINSAAPRVHLDFYVPDVAAAAALAVRHGATVVGDFADDGYVALASPAGLAFCMVDPPGGRRPASQRWPQGQRSRVAQVCIDVPPQDFEAEVAFWGALTGWTSEPFPGLPQVAGVVALQRPEHLPLRMIVQQLDPQPEGVAAGAHLEWWTDDLAAEVSRHLGEGATPVADMPYWSVLRDPAGLSYCVIARDPETGQRVPTAATVN